MSDKDLVTHLKSEVDFKKPKTPNEVGNDIYPRIYRYEGGSAQTLNEKGKAIVLVDFIRSLHETWPKGRYEIVEAMRSHFSELPNTEKLSLYQKTESAIKKGKTPDDYKNKGDMYQIARFYLRPSERDIWKGIDLAKQFRKLAVRYLVEKYFPQHSSAEVFNKTLDDPTLRTPSALGAALEKDAEMLRIKPNRPSVIDPALDGFTVPTDEYSLDKLRRAIEDDANSKIICLSGSGSSGRKTLLRSLLQEYGVSLRVDPRAGFIRLTAPASDPNRILSIFALECRELSSPDILQSIEAFLRPDDRGLTTRKSFRNRVDQIRQDVNERPAFFVLTGLDTSPRDPSHISIKNVDIRELLYTLAKASPHSRVLITTSENYETDFERTRALEVENFPVEARVLGDLMTFVDNDEDRYVHEALAEHLSSRYSEYRDCRISGSILSLAVGVLRVCRIEETVIGLRNTAEKIIKKLHDYLASRDSADASEPGSDAAQMQIDVCAGLWDLVKPALIRKNSDFEWILPHIAASDDGLSASTLNFLCRERDRKNGAQRFKQLERDLDWLAQLTSGRLVFRSEAAFGSRLELDPSEQTGAIGHHEEPLAALRSRVRYVIDALSARGLMRAVRLDVKKTSGPPHYRSTYRSIAKIARLRSELIKLQIKKVYGEDRRDLNRDILSYVALLASLDRESIERTTKDTYLDNPALRESAVFEPDEGTAVADVDRLRFAYYVILERDIDRDHRLTMKLDEDELRMTLLLQLFYGVGIRRRGPSVAKLKVPSLLPLHIRVAFGPKTCAEILTSLSIACLYADRPDRLSAVVRMAHSFLRDLKDKESATNSSLIHEIEYSLIRLWEAELDGYFLGYSHGRKGQLQWGRITKRINEIRTEVDQKSPHNAIHQLRLDIQMLRVSGYRQTNLEDICDNVNTIVNRASALSPVQVSTDANLSGRNTRRMIKALLGEPAFEAVRDVRLSPRYRDRMKLARDLLRINVSRLSQYSGGDRVGALVDRALVAAFSEDWSGATAFIEQATDDVLYHSLSKGLRADLLWHRAQILYGSALHRMEIENGLAIKPDVEVELLQARRVSKGLNEFSAGQFPYYNAVSALLIGMIDRHLGKQPDRGALRGALSTLQNLEANRILSKIEGAIGSEIYARLA